MTVDSLTVRALRDELRQELPAARIDRILHPAENAIGFDLYTGRRRVQLFLSGAPQRPAVFLTEERWGRQDERSTPLLLLARKYLKGGRIRAIEQVDLDRVLVFEIEQVDDDGGRIHTRVICELTGRLANLVLVDESGMILDALRRVPASINRVRTLMPRQPYQPPPPVAKAPLESLDAPDVEQLGSRSQGQPLWKVLVDGIAHVSPLLAREAVFRATGDVNAPASGAVVADALRWLRALFEQVLAGGALPTGSWSDGDLVAFAPYELTHLPGIRRANSLSQLIQLAYVGSNQRIGLEAQRARLVDRLDGLLARAGHVVQELEHALARTGEVERLRSEGEMLLAFQSQLEPGQTRLLVEGVVIALDPARSAVEQAQERFRAYRKLQSMAADLPARLRDARARSEWLATLRVHAETASSIQEIQLIEREVAEGGAKGRASAGESRRPSPKRGKRPEPSRGGEPGRLAVDGFEILYGRSARQNERVTFEIAGPHDLWLHARGVPGAHVVVRQMGRDAPPQVIARAAALAAALSTARSSAKVEVDVAEVRHVRKRPGGVPGLVTYRNESTLTVRPADESKVVSAER